MVLVLCILGDRHRRYPRFVAGDRDDLRDHRHPAGIGMILGVNTFLDMCRTTLNVTGDSGIRWWSPPHRRGKDSRRATMAQLDEMVR